MTDRTTTVTVMCPDNWMHGPVLVLQTSDGVKVSHRFTSQDSAEEWINPARHPEQEWALDRLAATVGSAEEWDALIAAQTGKVHELLDWVKETHGDKMAGGPAVVSSADPESVGAVRARWAARCDRPSCSMFLPLTVASMGLLEEWARQLWGLGVLEFDVQDVRGWLDEQSRRH